MTQWWIQEHQRGKKLAQRSASKTSILEGEKDCFKVEKSVRIYKSN